METNTNRLIIVEWLTLGGIFLSCFFMLKSDIKDINCNLHERMLAQEQRTDKLYEMFINLVQEGRK